MVEQELFINALLIKGGRRGFPDKNLFYTNDLHNSFCYLGYSQPLLHIPTNKVSFVSTIGKTFHL